jgi:hypothetical protein
VLGLPPVWYKSAPYRSRAVIDPRGVLADFGVTLPAETEIRVWDSTAETRFIVVPMRPARHRRLERGEARAPRHPQRHDRHRPRARAGRNRERGRDMNGVHDMGGMHGFGAVEPGAERAGVPRAVGRPRARDEPRHGLSVGLWNIDIGRFSREQLAAGSLSRQQLLQEMDARPRRPDACSTVWSARMSSRPAASLHPARSGQAHASRKLMRPKLSWRAAAFERPAPAPAKFKPGDRVRTRNINPPGHTRLPRYARGRCRRLSNASAAAMCFPTRS